MKIVLFEAGYNCPMRFESLRRHAFNCVVTVDAVTLSLEERDALRALHERTFFVPKMWGPDKKPLPGARARRDAMFVAARAYADELSAVLGCMISDELDD